jgi:hypothetical protein
MVRMALLIIPHKAQVCSCAFSVRLYGSSYRLSIKLISCCHVVILVYLLDPEEVMEMAIPTVAQSLFQ